MSFTQCKRSLPDSLKQEAWLLNYRVVHELSIDQLDIVCKAVIWTDMSFVMEDKELSMFERKIDSKCIFACCIEYGKIS